MVKKNSISIADITKNEISLVETNDKLDKLEKERLRDKKIIAEYKEREKATARALVLYERKIKYLKESSVEELLAICREISKTKEKFEKDCSKFFETTRSKFLDYKSSFAFFENNLYDVCNKLEKNAMITSSDRAFISNKKPAKSENPEDMQSRFDRLKQEFNQKIGSSVSRKPGRPKKNEQSIIADIGLRKKVEKKVDETDDAKDRLNEIFYEKPKAKKTVVSTIPETDDSLFDFNEALNPNLSLKDIMADLMTEKEEEVITYNESINKLNEAKKKTDMELLESGYMRNPVIRSKNKGTQNKTIDQVQKKPTFEKRFLSIQDIVKNTK